MRLNMKQEKERLISMLQEKKISPDEYNLLLAALEKKSFFEKISSSFLINPFQKIAGFKALISGMIVLIIMSYLGVIAKVYFIGALSILNASAVVNQKIEINFFLLAYQNLVAWLVLATLFLISAKILYPKKVRVIDFFGTVALARFPLLVLTLLMAIIRVINPEFLAIDLSKGIPLHPSIMTNVFGVIILCLFVWQITTYFYGFKVSSGLTGKKLWLGFIGSLIVAEYLTSPLTTLFMN
jgi:hypothetical protein